MGRSKSHSGVWRVEGLVNHCEDFGFARVTCGAAAEFGAVER